jgi:tetratricopeptide (TPR) repeat protein
MIAPLLAALLFAPQAIGDSGSLTLTNGPNEALLRNGRYFQYVRTVEQELTRSPSNAELHASLALGYFLLGQRRFCDEEIQQALTLLEGAPSPPVAVSTQVHYLAGRLAMENTKYQSAVNHFQAALLLNPADSKIDYFLGVCLLAINQPQSAKLHFEHACRAALYSWPCRALADIELDEGKAAAAQRDAAQAVQLEPASAEAQLVAGKAAQALGDTPAAVSLFQRAAELDPSWEVPHYFLGHLYQKMPGRAAEAAQEQTRVQELYNAGR